MRQRHRVWAEIGLDALHGNAAAIRSLLPRSTRLMAVVKADAYGLGATVLARELMAADVDAFGVGDSTEALELRSAGVRGMVLVLGAIIQGEVERVVRSDVSVCIHSESRIDSLVQEARRQGRYCRVHLKVDTGMGRLGVLPSRALELARKIARQRELVFEGVATHLAGNRAIPDTDNEEQLERFAQVRDGIGREGLGEPLYHATASAGLLSAWGRPHDMVRIGIALHGVLPPGAVGEDGRFQPVLSLHTQVVYLKDVPAGTRIGYQRRYETPVPTRIATIPVGYNDCLPGSLCNRGFALVRGSRAPYVGAISMDYATIDVGDIRNVQVGDPVTILGEDGAERIRLEDLAEAAGTIPHELLCSVGKRVARLYRPVTRPLHRVAAAR